MNAPTTVAEDKWNALAQSGASKTEKLNELLKHQVLLEKRNQRIQDEDFDQKIERNSLKRSLKNIWTNPSANQSPISLFSRQKKRGAGVICLTLMLLTLIHGIQIIALYNFNTLSEMILTDSVNDYVERNYWWSTSNVVIQSGTANQRHDAIRAQIGASESSVKGLMERQGYCLTQEGFLATLFNLTVGLFFMYLFIFSDVWKVIFATTITRNFPEDPHFKLCLAGLFWLVCLNAAILTWLGVECGFSVVASSGDFYTVLFNSLSIFIILKLDETVLPLIRFFIEDAGHVDPHGNLSEERLSLITHGSQYYKPGYGQYWLRTIRHGQIHLRVIAILNVFVALTIVIAPLAVTIDYAIKTFVRC